ncbi:MAG: hypothetical protein HYY52_02640 [Candidatus Melainabacteria bacterium]|nr:hypothetical protein [Candidatus Melainabacteria bacterium]
MIASTPPVNQKHDYYPPVFISPVIKRDKKKLEKFLKEELKNFSSRAIYNEDKLISLSDVFPEHYRNNDGFLEEAAKDICVHRDKDARIFHAKQLIQKGLDVGVELNKKEALYVIDKACEKVEKTIDWAHANKIYGNESATYAIEASILSGVISAFEQLDYFPPSLMIGLKALHGYTQGMRGKKLYGHIYGRADDDKGVSVFQRDNYENVAGTWAELSCTFETNIKPYVLPFLSFLDSDKIETATSLLTLPTNSLWSLRYLALSDQRLGNYLFKYAKNILPAVLGKEESKEAIEEIIKSEVLSINHLKGRVKGLLRLKEGEKASSKLGKLFLGLFSRDIKVLENSARILNETIAPFIGIAGFSFLAIFMPLRGVTAFTKDEYVSDSLKRKINSLARIRGSFQNVLYSLRFSTKEYARSVQLKDYISKLDEDDPTKKELEPLVNNFSNLSKIGLIGNAINIFMPAIELIDDSSPLKKILKSVLSETGYGISQWFFPKRRELRGKLFEAANLDLYEPPEEPPPSPPKLKIYRGDV